MQNLSEKEHKIRNILGTLSLKTLDPTPKKVLYVKSAPMSDRSWQGVKTFFGVGSPNIKGSNPEESSTCIREVSTYV